MLFNGRTDAEMQQEINFRKATEKDYQETLKEERSLFFDKLSEKDLEIQRLTNLILKDRGLIIESSEVRHSGEVKSIQKRHISPKERQRQLELNDLEVHAEMLKQRWAKENGTESDSTGTSAS